MLIFPNKSLFNLTVLKTVSLDATTNLFTMSAFNSYTKCWSGPERPGTLNPEANLGQVVLDMLARTPEKIIQINADNDRRMTCAEMSLYIVRVALNLKRLGLQKGDRVSLVCANSDFVTPVFVGCMTIGLVVNPLAPIFNKDDLVPMMRQNQSRLVFCDQSNHATVTQAVKEALESAPILFVMDTDSIQQLLQPVHDEDCFEPELLGNSYEILAAVMCTSGSTGLPKGAQLSHAFMIGSDGQSASLNAGPIFNFSQPFWISGAHLMITALMCNRPRVITSEKFSVPLLAALIERFRIEELFTAPVNVSEAIRDPQFQRADLSSVRIWIVGGGTIAEELLAKLNGVLPNGTARRGYGSSEIGYICGPTVGGVVPQSAGKLATNLQCKIVDPDGARLGPGGIGEIRIRHKIPFLGYYQDPQATRDAFDEEGFFKMGDIGYFNDDGYLFVVDRIKDMIKQDNYQISPMELEVMIQKIPGVRMVSVVGVPNGDKSSELVTAVVVREPGSGLTEQRVAELVNGQVSEPKRLQGGVVFVEQLPTTTSGKVSRRAVRDMILG